VLKSKIRHVEQDLGYREINRQIRIIQNSQPVVEVGILEGAGNADPKDPANPTGQPISLALLATVHEYGSPKRHIPQRSFIRSTMDEKAPTFHRATNALIDQVTDGSMTVERALAILGLLIKKEIMAKIQSNIAPPLSPETLARKNHTKIAKAKNTIDSIGKRGEARGYRQGQRASMGAKGQGPVHESAFKPIHTTGEVTRLVKAANLVQSGGNSTALIDTGQLIHSIDFKVNMGNAGGETGTRVDDSE
jgi:hypothetical protein